jgi:hypothetical protein
LEEELEGGKKTQKTKQKILFGIKYLRTSGGL